MRDKFGKHIVNFNVSHYKWINEKKSLPIYAKISSKIKIDQTSNYQNKIARVISVKKLNKVKYFYLEINNKEIGWCALPKSPTIYSKPKEFVKYNFEKVSNNKADQFLNVDFNDVSLSKHQMHTSLFMMILNDKVYEGVFKGNNFQGWFDRDVLFKSQKTNILITSYKDGSKFYEFNNLTNEVDIESLKFSPAKLVFIFPELDLAKVKTPEGQFWTLISNLELEKDIPEYRPEYNYQDVIIYDLIQNISQERRIIMDLVEKLKYQYEGHDIKIEENDKKDSHVNKNSNEYIDEIESLKEKIDVLTEDKKNITQKYNNLKSSKLGSLQTYIWKLRKR